MDNEKDITKTAAYIDQKEFGQFIKKLRIDSGDSSQRQLAEVSGISNGTIARIENGTQKPTPETLMILDMYLEGTDYFELMSTLGYISDEKIQNNDTSYLKDLNKLRNEIVHNKLNIKFENEEEYYNFLREKFDFYIKSLDNTVLSRLEFLLTKLDESSSDGSLYSYLKFAITNLNKFDEHLNGLVTNAKVIIILQLILLLNDLLEGGDLSKFVTKVNDFVRQLNDNTPKMEHEAKILRIPILGHIAAGAPILAEEHISDWTEIPNIWSYKEDELFMLEVKGDSMIGSRIYEGDKVLVKVQQEVENGEIAVVNVNGYDATLKKVKKINGQTWLFASNDKYDPILIEHERARIIGKVIQVMFEP